MALIKKESMAVRWAGATTKVVTPGATENSDLMFIPENAIAARIQFVVTVAGAVAGDDVNFWIGYSTGDVNGGGDDYDHSDANFIDLTLGADDGASGTNKRSISFDTSAEKFTIFAKNAGPTRNATVSARITWTLEY